jgi:cyclopropane fatty-acyl-phospholipid synthase-like methyltransferase
MKEDEKIIIEYFDECEVHYKRLWRLNKNMAIHYGYWDENTKTLSEALENENKLLAKLAAIKQNDEVLDAGCGVGGSAIFLAKQFGCRVTGITLSKKQVDSCYKNAEKHSVSDHVKFICGNFTKMDFADETFDVVWAIESACYAPDKKELLKEFKRVLKTGGRLIIADGFLKDEVLSKRENRKFNKWINSWGMPNLSRISEFQQYLNELNYGGIEIYEITKYVMPSAEIIYVPSVVMYPLTKILEWIRIRKRIQSMHIYGSIYQYITLRDGIWHYCIFKAVKR